MCILSHHCASSQKRWLLFFSNSSMRPCIVRICELYKHTNSTYCLVFFFIFFFLHANLKNVLNVYDFHYVFIMSFWMLFIFLYFYGDFILTALAKFHFHFFAYKSANFTSTDFILLRMLFWKNKILNFSSLTSFINIFIYSSFSMNNAK